jgi:hypothetical protein
VSAYTIVAARPNTSDAGLAFAPSRSSGARYAFEASVAPAPRAGDAEDEAGVAVGRDDDVLGPHVAVDHSRSVLVQVIERVGDRGQLAEDGRNGEPGITAFAHDSFHVRSVDLVHDEHVPVVEEEVVAHDGERGMRGQLEEHAPLCE